MSRNEFCQETGMRVKEKMESGHESSMTGPYGAALSATPAYTLATCSV